MVIKKTYPINSKKFKLCTKNYFKKKAYYRIHKSSKEYDNLLLV